MTATLNTISTMITRTVNTEIVSKLAIEVASSPKRGLFLMAEGDAADLAAFRAFAEKHLGAALAFTDGCDADEDGPACAFYAVTR